VTWPFINDLLGDVISLLMALLDSSSHRVGLSCFTLDRSVKSSRNTSRAINITLSHGFDMTKICFNINFIATLSHADDSEDNRMKFSTDCNFRKGRPWRFVSRTQSRDDVHC